MLRSIGEKDDSEDCIWLGRYRVVPEAGGKLDDALNAVAAKIDAMASQHWIVNRAVLIKLVRESLEDKAPIDDIISSTINWRCRLGVLTGMICESTTLKPLWVFYHVSRSSWVHEALEKAETILNAQRVVAVRKFEQVLFGKRSYNTWSATHFVLARLVRQGRAEYLKNDEFTVPRF